MYLAYPERVADTRTAARTMLGCQGWLVVHELSQVLDAGVHQGRFDWVQLRTWQKAIAADTTIHWIFADIDERQNRLQFGVENEEDRAHLHNRALDLGVPSTAVHSVITSEPVPG